MGTNIQTALRLNLKGLVSNRVQPPGAPSSTTPCSPIEATAPEISESTSTSQRGSDAGQAAQTPLESHDKQRYDGPQPYATTLDLWKEALKSLDGSQTHDIEKLIEPVDHNSMEGANAIAVTIRDKISEVFKGKEHDGRMEHIVENTVSVLNKFVSAVDVAVSYDPVHAALPWAVVRYVLTAFILRSELKSKLLVGVAMVASLLVQCDTCQQLYMTPDPNLRPPEDALEALRQRIIQAYAKSQGFLGFAVRLQQSGVGPVVSPFKLQDLEAHVSELAEREKDLSRATEICEKQCNSSHRSDVQEFHELSRSFYRGIQDQIKLVKGLIEDKNLIELLEWISPMPYRSYHNRVIEARTPNTCEWLLQHEKFHEWEASPSAILWLQGSPGAGKTFLASKVIDHIQARLESSSGPAGFAFFYCDRNDEQRRTPLSVLRSFVRQLSTSAQNPGYIRKSLQDLYRKRRMEGSGLSLSDCKEQLLESVNFYAQTTIVLDALDECEPESRHEIVNAIESVFKSRKSLKVFISSRPDRDIRQRFSNKPNIDIQATHNENDIMEFVNEEITKHGRWAKMSTDLRSHIVRVLHDRSEGMFQWVFLQTKELLNLETDRAIKARLGVLPSGLKTLYDEIYSKIKARSDHDRILVENAFKWVMCAIQPLTSKELLSAIRLDSAGDTYDLADNITESQLLHLCNNLLVLDSQRQIWRFSHLSVAEYFEENHWGRRKANCHAAIVCLKLLIKAHFESEDLGKDPVYYGRSICRSIWNRAKYGTDDERNDQYGRSGELDKKDIFHSIHPLQKYARTQWVRHIQTQEGQESPDPILSHLLSSFLGSPEESSPQYQRWYNLMEAFQQFDKCLDGYSNLEYDLAPPTVAWFAVCRFSFYTTLSDWWDVAVFDTSRTNEKGANLLAIAVLGGCKSICKNLIRRGVDVNLQLKHNDYGSALAVAACGGNLEIVKFLVDEAKADVNLQLQQGYYGSALAAAVLGGNPEIVKFLVDKAKADVNLQLESGNYGSALAAAVAVYGGNLEIY